MADVLGKKKRKPANAGQAQSDAGQPQSQPQPQPQPQPEPKRSHHRQTAQLRVPLPLTWERIEGRGLKALRGIRMRPPKTVREAALKNVGFRGRKIEFRSTPKITAFNDAFAEKFDRRCEIKRKTPQGTQKIATERENARHSSP